MDSLFITLQWIIPQHLLSRTVGWLASCEISWLKNALIGLFISHYNVNMSEALDNKATSYSNFNDFFTRELKPGSRPLADSKEFLLNPADGAISQIGRIESGRIFQAKGQEYTTSELLGGSDNEANVFQEGNFATIYLSPKDYHRVHMPINGTLIKTRYIKGDLFSVNQTTAENVPRLFARNERLICLFDTDIGELAIVLVGAMIVAGIETVWAGKVSPNTQPSEQLYNGEIKLKAGDELGRFYLGSTVILLTESGKIHWDKNLVAGTPVRMGTALANFKH